MPLYEYQCESCGEVIEKLQSRGAPAPERCPSCHTEGTLSRIISNTSFQLKGSGWYVTDYKDQGSSGASAKKDEAASSEAPSESTQEGSSDQGSSSESGASSSSSSEGGASAA